MIAVDISIKNLSKFLASNKFTPNLRSYIINDKQEMIEHQRNKIQEYDDEGTPVSKSAIENRIMQVTNFMKKHFGRFTIRDISNSHIDTKGNLVMKSSIIISSYPSDEEFNSNKLKLMMNCFYTF